MKPVISFLVFTVLLMWGCATPPPLGINPGTDFHMHVHAPEDTGDDVQFDAKRALFAADSINLRRALILPNGYSKNANEYYTKKQNDYVRTEAEKNRTQLVAACAVNPTCSFLKYSYSQGALRQ